MDFLYMWISSLIHSIYALEKKYQTNLEDTEKKKIAGGFGFAGRDGNRGVDLVLPWVRLVLQETSRSGFGFAVGALGFAGDFTEWVWFCCGSFLLFLLSSSSPSFYFVLLLCSCSLFLRSVNRVCETRVLRV